MFNVTFLGARVPLVKAFTQEGVKPYPNVKRVTSYEHACANIQQLHELISDHAKQRHAFFTGKLVKPLQDESRRGQTVRDYAMPVLCLDIDGLHVESDVTNVRAVAEEVIDLLPENFRNVSCVAQASAKMGLTPHKAALHLFFVLDNPAQPAFLKSMLVNLNHTIDAFEQAITLQKSGFGLSYKLDVCTADSSRIVYIAHPGFGAGLANPIPDDRRIVLLEKRHDKVTLSGLDAGEHRNRVTRKINALRNAAGLEEARPKLSRIRAGDDQIEVLINPAPGRLILVEDNGEFCRYNIDNGDSAAYWHPCGKPDIIFNFKNEPPFLWERMDPEGYAKYCEDHAEEIRQHRPIDVFPIQNHLDNGFYIVEFDSAKNHVNVCPAKTEQITNRMAAEGRAVPEPLPVMQIAYDPQRPLALDRTAAPYPLVNLYKHSELLTDRTILPQLSAPLIYGNARVLKECCPKTFTLIQHLLCYDEVCVNHFINWLAFICQFREKTGIAWVFQGIEGTGKGALFNKLLSPILGNSNCVMLNNTTFDEKHNGWRQGKLLVMIDEFQVENDTYRNNLWNAITEPVAPIREMRSDTRNVRVYDNYIMGTNRESFAPISKDARRFNIAPRQEVPLRDAHPRLVAAIADGSISKEAPLLAAFLMSWTVDTGLATVALQNQAKDDARKAAQTTMDELCEAIKTGDLEPFLLVLEMVPMTIAEASNLRAAQSIVADWVKTIDQRIFIPTMNLFYVFRALGMKIDHPKVFGKMLARHGINADKRRTVGVEKPRGIETTFLSVSIENIVMPDMPTENPHAMKAH